MKLEDLRPGSEVKGVLPNGVVSVVDVKWFGSDVLELTYKDPSGRQLGRIGATRPAP